MSEKKYPKFVVGAFIFNLKGELFLRTTPSQNNKFTCINAKVEWGDTIEQTLKNCIKQKTNLGVIGYELIGLTDGLNIPADKEGETINMIFADYRVYVDHIEEFESDDSSREHLWLTPEAWLKKDRKSFGPYIYEIIEKLI